MTLPVTYTEIHSPAPELTSRFMSQAFGWNIEPFAVPEYLVADAGGTAGGVDTGILPSRDGQARSVCVIRVPRLEPALTDVAALGGQVVVPPFTIAGVGRGCYVLDPAGVLLGLHEYDADAR